MSLFWISRSVLPPLFALVVLCACPVAALPPPPEPTLTFATTIRVAEAFASSPGAAGGDGCLAAEARLSSAGRAGSVAVSEVSFDAKGARIRQSNTRLELHPTQNVTSIGLWAVPTPLELDITFLAGGGLSCQSQALPKVLCPNGTRSCEPFFGTWGSLNPFTSILGMFYPNTTKLEGFSTPVSDTYQLMDVRPTLLPNSACGTELCTMEHCGRCKHNGQRCTKCPCEQCIMELNVTRNYTYTVAKKEQADGTRQLLRYQWTQGIPLTKSGASPGRGRDCFIFDWSEDWTAEVDDSDFAPPPGVPCS